MKQNVFPVIRTQLTQDLKLGIQLALFFEVAKLVCTFYLNLLVFEVFFSNGMKLHKCHIVRMDGCEVGWEEGW